MGHFTTFPFSCQTPFSPTRRIIPENSENRLHHRGLTIRTDLHNQQRMDRVQKKRLLSVTGKATGQSCEGIVRKNRHYRKGEWNCRALTRKSQLIRYAYIVGKHQCHCTSRGTSRSTDHQALGFTRGSVTDQDRPVLDHMPNQFQLQ